MMIGHEIQLALVRDNIESLREAAEKLLASMELALEIIETPKYTCTDKWTLVSGIVKDFIDINASKCVGAINRAICHNGE